MLSSLWTYLDELAGEQPGHRDCEGTFLQDQQILQKAPAYRQGTALPKELEKPTVSCDWYVIVWGGC